MIKTVCQSLTYPASSRRFSGLAAAPGAGPAQVDQQIESVADGGPPTELFLENPRGTWTPLKQLRTNAELLDYFLRELRLLGGLCCGANGLSLNTVRALYPFALAMEMATDEALPSELRAAEWMAPERIEQLVLDPHAAEGPVSMDGKVSANNWRMINNALSGHLIAGASMPSTGRAGKASMLYYVAEPWEAASVE